MRNAGPKKRQPVATRRAQRSGETSTAKRRAGRPKVTPEMAAEFEAVVDSIEADVQAHIRLKRWKGLTKLLRFYNRVTGSRGAYWLHVTLFRTAVRQVQTLSDSAAVYQWS